MVKTKKRKLVILGATGSIGTSSLDIIRRNRKDFDILGLSTNGNISLLKKQISEFRPRYVSVEDSSAVPHLQKWLQGKRNKTQIFNHQHGLEKLAKMKSADFVMCGVVGFRGLLPLIEAIKAGKKIGLANKEALIVAGPLIQSLVKKHKATIIPVDSEHSAIFQCLKGQNHGEIKRIILTASGGPFYRYKKPLNSITVDHALDHPTWKMGKKITIDSATLMNKGLEAIEAHYLFNVPMNKISIVIHPQSIVHSLVEFEDGAQLAQLSHPDMRLPIQYALTYPNRFKTPIKRLNLEGVGMLNFDEPDFSRFPCLQLALDAGRKGGSAPVALSSSNEEAVRAFMDRRISFTDIPQVVKKTVSSHPYKKKPALSDILRIDVWSRKTAQSMINKLEKN